MISFAVSTFSDLVRDECSLRICCILCLRKSLRESYRLSSANNKQEMSNLVREQ